MAPLTKSQLKAKLAQCINILIQLEEELDRQGQKPAAQGLGVCPIHHVPWRQYDFGIAHPPQNPGDKWCKKEAVDKKSAGAPEPIDW